jgi:hypothetical protein
VADARGRISHSFMCSEMLATPPRLQRQQLSIVSIDPDGRRGDDASITSLQLSTDPARLQVVRRRSVLTVSSSLLTAAMVSAPAS